MTGAMKHSQSASSHLSSLKQAQTFEKSGQLEAALDLYKSVLKRNLQTPAAWLGLARVMHANQQTADALACVDQGLHHAPEARDLLILRAIYLTQLGQVEEARRVFEGLVSKHSRDVGALFGLGQSLEDLGQPERAADAYRTALSHNRDHMASLAQLLGLGRYVDVSPEVERAREELSTLPNRERALVGYGLGKELERRKDPDAAMEAFNTANFARREEAGIFDRNRFDARVDRFLNLFSTAFFKDRSEWGVSSETAVFVVGLPRSGTTLTEQIISSHTQCFGAGELNNLSDLVTGAPDRFEQTADEWPGCAPMLARNQAEAIGADYVEQTQALTTGSMLRIVDKQPLNFWHLGALAIILPNARIIHCKRDLRDTGLSIYAQNFNPSQTWSTDLGDIAHYWRGYRRVMAHWQNVTGLKTLEVQYEDTVSDLEVQARRLLEFVDLPWDGRVLAFHKQERAVQTPSRWQVRQPIYASSKAKWKRYEQHIKPLMEAVEEAS